MIAKVVELSTGMVAVLDENEEQMPEYQGAVAEAARKLIKADTTGTKFYACLVGQQTVEVTREEFFKGTLAALETIELEPEEEDEE